MELVDARWTPKINILIIHCKECQRTIEHRADRWTVHCHKPCKNFANLAQLRWWYVQNKQLKG